MPITEVDFLGREWRCLLLRIHVGNTMLTNGRHEITLFVTPKYKFWVKEDVVVYITGMAPHRRNAFVIPEVVKNGKFAGIQR